ncbi:leucine-rich_repeat domain-containing protein [Hexamita inflata]|uniref:Leucine-rich repeat domain-containing protein n=1 Tax=Hexamita inflata TaxID=28002 RepID=A0AA86Q294_9EUKA|nr:leucine-rich repeat domain-containing protein [Hexamita inflata]
MSFESGSTYEYVAPAGSKSTYIKQFILQLTPKKDQTDESVLGSVTEFELCSQKLLDSSPISKLRNLRALKLVDTQISDVAFVGSLAGLTQLDLFRNDISDISAIAKLPNLLQLNVSHNRVSDLSPLASCAKLVWLFAQNNCVLDVSPLEHLACMDTLWIYSNSIAIFAPVKHHPCFNQYRIGNQSAPTQKQLLCRDRAARIQEQSQILTQVQRQRRAARLALRNIQKRFQDKMEKCKELLVYQIRLFIEVLEADNEVWQ